MSAAGKLIGRVEEGNLDEIGACLAAIRSMSTHCGAIDEEDARAIYSLSCIALIEWRKLDEEAANPKPKHLLRPTG